MLGTATLSGESESLLYPLRGVRVGGLQSEDYGHLDGHLADEADLHRCPDSAIDRWAPVIRSSQIHHLAPPDEDVTIIVLTHAGDKNSTQSYSRAVHAMIEDILFAGDG